RTLFVSGDVSLTRAAHGDTLAADVADAVGLFWQPSSAVVGVPGFPLQSPGQQRVFDLVRAQIRVQAGADSVYSAGSRTNPVFTFAVPDDGGKTDRLDEVALVQHGTARAGLEIESLHLQSGPAPWTDVGAFVPTGGNRWSSTGLDLAVPPGGANLRVVA